MHYVINVSVKRIDDKQDKNGAHLQRTIYNSFTEADTEEEALTMTRRLLSTISAVRNSPNIES